jgi:hypothetical protein
MNRLLLLFVVLLISFAELHAGPPVSLKGSTHSENPISMIVANVSGVSCESVKQALTFKVALPQSELLSATINFDDGQGDVLLDSTQLQGNLDFNRAYKISGTKHVKFRLLKTNGLYEELNETFYLGDY